MRLAVIAVLLVTVLAMPALAVRYEVINLSNSLYYNSSATSINDNGVVVGYANRASDGRRIAFKWENGTITQLPSVQYPNDMGISINSSGQVAGCCKQPMRAALWSNGALTDLGTLGGSQSWSQGINDKGQVVGHSNFDATSFEHSFLWESGRMVDLGIGQSRAYAINNNSVVIGSRINSSGYNDAYAWQGGVLRLLPNKGLSGSCSAYAINDFDHVAGSLPNQHAALWQGESVIDLDPSGIGSIAYGLNDNDQVVGQFYKVKWDSRAFLWKNGAIYDLNDLIPIDSGWGLTWAQDINNKGQIVGYGSQGAFLLNPVPEPSSIFGLIAGLATLTALKRRKRG